MNFQVITLVLFTRILTLVNERWTGCPKLLRLAQVLPTSYNTTFVCVWLHLGQTLNASATGKPVDYGGVDNYDKVTATGAFKALDFIINNGELLLKTGCIKTGINNKRFIIQAGYLFTSNCAILYNVLVY